MAPVKFRLEASYDDVTGRMVAVYLRVRDGEVAETREPKEGFAYADYSADGELLGVELLGPCDANMLESVGRNEAEPVRRFLLDSVPFAFVASPTNSQSTRSASAGPSSTRGASALGSPP